MDPAHPSTAIVRLRGAATTRPGADVAAAGPAAGTTDGPAVVGRQARIGVLVSGAGSNLVALDDAMRADPDFGASIVLVATDRPDCVALDRARQRGLATSTHLLEAHTDRAAWEEGLVAALIDAGVDTIVLAGFLRVVSARFLAAWPDRVLNTHPSLLPAFPGAHAVRDALTHGVRVTGATVHLVDEIVDHGPILAQRCVAIEDDDTEESLHARIRAVEHELLPACVRALCQGRVVIDGRHVTIEEVVR